MKARITSVRNNWVEGECGNYTFCAKVYPKPSKHGIYGGRVSKLLIHPAGGTLGACIAHHDRGWILRPATRKEMEIYDAVLDCLDPELNVTE